MIKIFKRVLLIVLVAGLLLGSSGLLGGTGGMLVGLCSLTILINWAMIYSATYSSTGEKTNGKQLVLTILSVLQLSIPICAVFWWAVSYYIWPDNMIIRGVIFCLALPCLLAMPARKMLFSVDGVAFNIKLPGINPIIVAIIIIGIVLGGVVIVFQSCSMSSAQKAYIEALENIDVEVYDKYFNDETGKFDFAIRIKNDTPYTLKDMRFAMKVYDKTGELLIDTTFYLPDGAAFSSGEERRFYVYVKQSDVKSVEALYNANIDSLEIQMWIMEVEYEEYDSPLNVNYKCLAQTAKP